MHGLCPKFAYEWDAWIKPMHDAVHITMLQDTAEVDFFRQIGKEVKFHDDLVVYDQCGDLVSHLCSEGPMGSCSQMPEAMVNHASLRTRTGYRKVHAAALEAARLSYYGCGCAEASVGKEWTPRNATRAHSPVPADSARSSVMMRIPAAVRGVVAVLTVLVLWHLARWGCRKGRNEHLSNNEEPSVYGCRE